MWVTGRQMSFRGGILVLPNGGWYEGGFFIMGWACLPTQMETFYVGEFTTNCKCCNGHGTTTLSDAERNDVNFGMGFALRFRSIELGMSELGRRIRGTVKEPSIC
jgi:hypothetical protein